MVSLSMAAPTALAAIPNSLGTSISPVALAASSPVPISADAAAVARAVASSRVRLSLTMRGSVSVNGGSGPKAPKNRRSVETSA